MTITSITDTARLSNGVGMPWLGLGVLYIPEGEILDNAVRWALQTGYRHFDTAPIYGNEAGLGRALRASGLPRQELFVTSKVWNSDQGYQRTLAALQASLERLGMEYVDLYLVHWPVPGQFKETWRALETIYQAGQARAIGVSNFLIHHLQELLHEAHIPPMVNQVEFHPYLQQPDLLAFCRQQCIQVEAWRPLMKGRVDQVPELVRLGQQYGRTPAQITLRWMLQRGVVTIPKSAQPARIQANADIFDFELSPQDMAVVDGLDRNQRLGKHPDHIDF